MPSEIIGEVGTAGAERKQIAAEAARAIKYLKKTCGEPPLGYGEPPPHYWPDEDDLEDDLAKDGED